MWRRSLTLRSALQKQQKSLTPTRPSRWLSTAALSPEELELLNEPREGMDYDVLLVRYIDSLSLSLCVCVSILICVRWLIALYLAATLTHIRSAQGPRASRRRSA